MCVISMVMDMGQRLPDDIWNPQTIDDFRKMTESARRMDEHSGQKDCVDPEKEKFMERLQLFERRYALEKHLAELKQDIVYAEEELKDIDAKLDKNA